VVNIFGEGDLHMQKITTFLAFQKDGMKAVDFYCSIFKDSHISHKMTVPDSGQLLHAAFILNGQEFMAIESGEHPGFFFTDAVSLYISCVDQVEVDYFWEALLSDGGETQSCGWLKDQFGVRWQVIPERLGELMSDPDPVKSNRVMQAMLGMTKINVADLELAYEG
jgi:predicted 3-demethylubiquinone-9 3-methyltransferase (glyoxalase superfamily)